MHFPTDMLLLHTPMDEGYLQSKLRIKSAEILILS